MDNTGDTTTHKALRVVLNETTNEAIKQMQKDSEELACLKKQLPILTLGQKDIDNHQTGQYLEEVHHLNYKHYLFQGKSHGIYKWRLDDWDDGWRVNDDGTEEHLTEEHLSLEEMMNRGFRHCPCPRYGCDGEHDHCPFGDIIDELELGRRCGLHYLAKGFHLTEEIELTEEEHAWVGFDLIWKKEPDDRGRHGVLKEVQCKCCGKVLPEADIIDHIYNYQHPIWKCPHEKV